MNDFSDLLKRYSSLMEDVKRRQAIIYDYLTQKKTTGFLITDIEFLSLQFRKILEHIALASLVANKDEYAKQYEKFYQHWNAKRILTDIEKINPDFYPIPTKQIINKENGKVRETIKISEKYLTRIDFIEAYDECSKILHTNNPYGQAIAIKETQSKFSDWYTKIINLLNHHQIQLIDSNYQIWTVMQTNQNNMVQCSLFEKINEE